MKAVTEDAWGNAHIQSNGYVFEQTPQRQGELNAMEEDEHGTYLFNSKDLRAIQHVETLANMGIDCVKIEGRTKSDFYVARTTQLYRRAIDDAVAGRPFDKQLMEALEGLSLRGYTEGFYRRHVPEDYQSYNDRTATGVRQQVVADLLDYDAARGKLTVHVKNQFSVGDTIELMLPSGNHVFCLEAIEKQGQAIACATGSGHIVELPVNVSDYRQLEHGYLIRHWQD